MPYDFFDLQQNVMDAQKIINSYYVIMQDYDDKITQIENETNEKIDEQAAQIKGGDNDPGLAYARYLDTLLEKGDEIRSKTEGIFKYYMQSVRGAIHGGQSGASAEDVTFDSPEQYISYMESLYEALSTDVMSISNSSKGVLGLGRKMLGVDNDKNQQIFQTYNQLTYVGNSLYDKLNVFQEKYLNDREKQLSDNFNKMSKEADDKVDRLTEEMQRKTSPLIDQLQTLFDIHLSVDYMRDFKGGYSEGKVSYDFPAGEYCWYIGYYKQFEDINKIISERYEKYIHRDYVRFRTKYNISGKRSFILNYNSDKNAALSIVETLVLNQLNRFEIGMQLVTVCSYHGEMEGMNNLCEMCSAFPNIVQGVYVQREQVRNTINEYVEIMNDILQNRLKNHKTVQEYNEDPNIRKKIPFRTLVLVDYEVNDDLFDKIQLLIKEGVRAGIQTLLITKVDLDENRGDDREKRRLIDTGCAFYQLDDCWRSLSNDLMDWVFSEDIQEYTLSAFWDKFSEAYKTSRDSYLKFGEIIEDNSKHALSSAEKLSIPIGVNEYGEIQCIEMGDGVANGTSHYGLIVGPTGSGKSSLLHTIIMSSVVNYSPEELELYLLDFKQGNEFKIYENKKIPHLKCLGLDVMQEFGESVLNDLWKILEKRNDMFAQASGNGIDIKNISDYRKAGYKMPRILVIMDEFQVLFNTAQNKRVAYNAAALLSDFVSRARVYGIHFLLATQTLRKIYESSALTKGTLEEMHIRIALQCPESELSSLIGEENVRKCISKAEKKRGSGIYLENDIVSEPVAMQVAYVETEEQNRILDEISREYPDEFENQESNMYVFRGSDSPELGMQDIEHYDDKIFILGEKIGLGDPISVEIGKKRKTDMLVVGEDSEIVNNITRLWIAQAMKKTAMSDYNNIYIFDGSMMIDEEEIVNETLSMDYNSPMVVIDNIFSVLHTIDMLYEEYTSRKQRMMQGSKIESDKENIYVVISNYQWIESLMRVMENGNIDEFMPESMEESTMTGGVVRDSDDPFERVNSMMDELSQDIFSGNGQGLKNTSGRISYYKKMKTMLSSGYYCGMHFYLSSTDVLVLKRLGQTELSVFRNRILFRTLSKDAYSIIDTTINVEGLGKNMAVYSNGINEPEIFRPYIFKNNER